jgi:hypothetical protein
VHPLARVRDENDGIGAGEDDAAGGVVLHLAGYRVELYLEVVARDTTQAERQQVEKQGPVLGGIQRDQAVVPGRIRELVDLFEVGGLARLRRAVIDHLGLDGPFAEIELDHKRSGLAAVSGQHVAVAEYNTGRPCAHRRGGQGVKSCLTHVLRGS